MCAQIVLYSIFTFSSLLIYFINIRLSTIFTGSYNLQLIKVKTVFKSRWFARNFYGPQNWKVYGMMPLWWWNWRTQNMNKMESLVSTKHMCNLWNIVTVAVKLSSMSWAEKINFIQNQSVVKLQQTVERWSLYI